MDDDICYLNRILWMVRNYIIRVIFLGVWGHPEQSAVSILVRIGNEDMIIFFYIQYSVVKLTVILLVGGGIYMVIR